MKHVRRFCITLIALGIFLAVLCGPAATHLQSRDTWADPAEEWDAIYLVCGARAQDRRITALLAWLASKTESRKQKAEIETKVQSQAGNSNISAFKFQLSAFPILLIGNDPQISLWCRQHQTNHTRTGWAEEKLKAEIGKLKLETGPRPPQMDTRGGNSGADSIPGTRSRIHATSVDESQNHFAPNYFAYSPSPIVVPGNFRNTDGEMAALAIYLKAHPEIQSIALATSRFHGRRLLQRYRKHIGDHPNVGLIPGIPYWENRAPWRVLAEYLKLLRDRLGLTSHLTRTGNME